MRKACVGKPDPEECAKKMREKDAEWRKNHPDRKYPDPPRNGKGERWCSGFREGGHYIGVEEFGKSKRYKDGLHSLCKRCEKKHNALVSNPDTAIKRRVGGPYHTKYMMYNKKRLQIPQNRLAHNIRMSLRRALRGEGKTGHTFELFGYTPADLVTHVTKLLESVDYICPRCGVWDMRNGYDLDHAMPLCTATTEEEVIALFALSNLQPLCSSCNASKNCHNEQGVYYYSIGALNG